MVSRTEFELATSCQEFVSNETRLRNDRNRIVEERKRYFRNHETSVAKNATTKTQVRRLTENITALSASNTGAKTASHSRLTARHFEL